MTTTDTRKPATLADVAARAGVSVPTASRVLNGGVRGTRSGSPEIRKRVKDAARALGYSVSTSAQAIKDGRSRTVALVVTDIDDYGSATVIAGMMHAAERRGLSVAVRTTHDDPERERELLTTLRGERHRAVILATSRTTEATREAAVDAQLRTLRDQGASVVIIGDSDLDYPSVRVDSHQAAAELASHLVGAGRRRFGIIAGPDDQITSRDRVDGFLAGLAPHGLTVAPENIVHTALTRDGGFAAVEQLADRLDEFDVLAAMTDTMAVGVIAALRRRGVAVPDDIDVTGFDHVPMIVDLLPEFSTVEIPLKAFGEAALSLALDSDDYAQHTPSIALRATTLLEGKPVG